MVLVQRHNYKHALQKTFLPLTHLHKNCKIHNWSHTILLSKPAHQTEEIHNLRLSLSHGFISPWRVFHFSEKLPASFTPTSKVSWKVRAFSLCMVFTSPRLSRAVPHGTKGTGPEFVTRPVYSRS